MPMTLKDLTAWTQRFPPGSPAFQHAQGQPFLQMRGQTRMPPGQSGDMNTTPGYPVAPGGDLNTIQPIGPQVPWSPQGVPQGGLNFGAQSHPTAGMHPQDMPAFLAWLQTMGQRR